MVPKKSKLSASGVGDVEVAGVPTDSSMSAYDKVNAIFDSQQPGASDAYKVNTSI